MADVRGLESHNGGNHYQHQVLREVAEALGYSDNDGYNHACMFRPREVLERIYGLKG